VLIGSAILACGCGKKAPNYTPSAADAEAALRRALDAWKAGEPAGPVPETKPLVHVTDAGRKPGQRLEDYRILGETYGTGGRTYAVVLHLTNPDEQVKTRYVLVGIDPLWVFRQEDYELLMHWDHHMPDEVTKE
jgi:hypothetical protein